MGASGWHYFVPHDPDIGSALARLREDVFQRGAYYKPSKTKKVASIAAALRLAAEDGTHSVLDVSRVVETPLPPTPFGAVAPVSEAQLVAAFGSTRPDHAAVEAGALKLDAFLTRGCGVYVVVYSAAGAPAEIFFAGVTGD